MPFYQVLDDIFEDQDEFLVWAVWARAASLRLQERKGAKKQAGRKKS
jgi:hypothetical protein